MSSRALRSWKDLAPEAVLPGPRPRGPHDLRRDQWLVARAWHRVGRHTGEGTLSKILEGHVPMRRVRDVLRALKARRRRIDRRLAEERRVHVAVHVRDAIWAQDATHLGRCPAAGHGRPYLAPVQGEVIKDVGTTRLLDVRVGPPASGAQIVAMLESLRTTRGLPLVYATDNGTYGCKLVSDYLFAHKVVHLKNLPHTPQHNAAAERGIGELKLESGLGRGVVLSDAGEAAVRVEKARCKIDHLRPRASRGNLTAAQLDGILPHWQAQVDRETFWREVCAAIERETMDAKNQRERRMRERAVILGTLQHLGAITRTRGGRLHPAVKPEVIS